MGSSNMTTSSIQRSCGFLICFVLFVCVVIFYHSNNRGTNVSDIRQATEETDDIIYSDDEIRREIEYIHQSNYQIKDDDTCTQTVPDCMIVGVAKSGTRELLDFMSIHPNIISKANPYTINIDWFNTTAGHAKIINEIPCKYSDQISIIKEDLFLTHIEPEHLLRFNPKMKIIAIIREPVSRIVSSITFAPRSMDKKKKEVNTFVEALSKSSNSNTLVKQPKLVNTSCYDEGLKRYLKIFEKSNILVIESNEFKKNPVSVVRKVEHFLGIKRFVSDDHFTYNSHKGFYCIHKTSGTSDKGMVCYSGSRGRKIKTVLSDETLETLRNYFIPHNENLYRILGKRFDW